MNTINVRATKLQRGDVTFYDDIVNPGWKTVQRVLTNFEDRNNATVTVYFTDGTLNNYSANSVRPVKINSPDIHDYQALYGGRQIF